ncbi:globin domain-containing protein [Streptomyces sp. NRRL S-118]|uniref:globin domain-containing protein n=1 Tax=Streptomyces sp. NRRL S-118 TaxID=1463881 RepID=UPI0004C50B58|nr:globin domain-containing protein [Streptomyces sp. NRRL S-118]
MDAPTTTSADNGTSGDSGGGGGWFTPRKPVSDRPAAPDPETDGGTGPGRQRTEGPRRPLTSIRLVGSGATRTASEPVATGHPADESTTQGGRTAHDRAAEHPDGDEYTAPGGPPAASRPVGDDRPVPEQRSAWESPVPVPVPVPGPRGPEAAGPASRASAADEPSVHGIPGTADVAESGSPDAIRVRRTLAEVAPVADKVTSYFYALLFTRHPDLRSLFPAAMDTQRDRLLKALLTAAEHMDNAEVLTEYLQHLGRGHRKYGTEASHYPAVGEALIGALSRYATTTWDEETEGAWVRTYTTISQIMIDAAAENERHAPAWWHAEVVSHDLRTPDIAVVTVRPDQPYPFLAGQYTSLETPWWPRVWRHYSFASAPRSDGLLSFHVKAVPAGWVSNALVHHARPGDVLRLGPPAGSMTVDHSTDNGLLCLGGGTGIAPIKALVEDVAEHGERRPVEVFYGARTDHDLYDIDTMLRLQQSHPWLEVRAIIDGKTQLPDVVREYGPWNEYDAYLSGPPGMIRSGVDALRGIGVPYERIRHDSLDELVAATT